MTIVWPRKACDEDDEITERARKFIAENPQVWASFVRYARALIATGRRRGSADLVVHRLVWDRNIETSGAEPYKINGHYTAIFARWFHIAYPEYAGFFETRKRKSGAEVEL